MSDPLFYEHQPYGQVPKRLFILEKRPDVAYKNLLRIRPQRQHRNTSPGLARSRTTLHKKNVGWTDFSSAVVALPKMINLGLYPNKLVSNPRLDFFF